MDHESQFIEDLNGEDDLGCVIRGHIHVEAELDNFIQLRTSHPDQLKGADLTYDQKIHLALALGLPTVLKSPLQYLGKVRNSFAHNLNRSIGKEEAGNFYKTFASEEKEYINEVIERVNAKTDGPDKKLKTMPVKEQFAMHVISLEASLYSLNKRVV
ncbi:MAG: hypothetical protein RKH07_15865 [Gammaproteobacteria bacterium]